jgi:Outer membrane protein beta-barrel domain
VSHRGPGVVRVRLLSTSAWLGLLLCVVMAAFRPASAQVSVDVWPSIGGYFPLSDFDRERPGSPGSNAGQGSQEAGVVMGFGGTAWLNDRLGLALHLATSGSNVTYANTFISGLKQDSRVSFYGAEVLVRVSGRSPKHGAYLGIGPTIVDRSGEAFEGLTHSSSLAGTLSFGSYYRLAQGLRLRGDLSGLLYRIHLEGSSDFNYPRSTQVDLLMRLGVAIDVAGLSSDRER